MNTASPAAPKARRRWPAPRFSLAAALVAMTLFAVGLWYWFRVPFEVVKVTKGRSESEWRLRTWGGTLLHGPRQVFRDGKRVKLKNYQAGVAHGRWEWRTYSGELFLSAEYERGSLLAIHPGPGCDKRLAELVVSEAIDNQTIRGELLKSTSVDFTGTPLKDAITILQDTHGVPIGLDLQALRGEMELPPPRTEPQPSEIVKLSDELQLRLPLDPDAPDELISVELIGSGNVSRKPSRKIKRIDAPVTCDLKGAPLIVAFGTILQPHGLVCDYRYGCLWITTPQLAGNDRTGVDKLVPPADSNLATVWDTPSSIDYIETPIAEALSIFSQQHNGSLQFDLSHLPPGFAARQPVIVSLKGLPVKHCVGRLLNSVGCKARLDGEMIVIELQN